MFNHISGVSGDAKHDVISCIYARLCSVMKLDTSRKIIVLKLINEEIAHAGLRNYAGVSKDCNTYFYGNIVVVKFY